jgi:Leu/Phe-tRNA-protein transferase
MYLRYTSGGFLFISTKDDPHRIVDAMLETNYGEEFCVAVNFDPVFIARLMEAGFLVMSVSMAPEPVIEAGTKQNDSPAYILLPKLHLLRSALFFENLHVKKSITRFLGRYELRVNQDFEYILDRCIETHGADWLTPPLVRAIKEIRRTAEADTTSAVKPTSFGVYRAGKLVAGEFGITVGRVYTSYSGYYDEDNAGTVQLIKTTRWLQEQGFAFFDLGMPLDYKTDLGAEDIGPERFVELFRAAQV